MRNSPPIVNLFVATDQSELFHYDGEFRTLEDLVIGTMVGRNFGWLTSEAASAKRHAAKIIREDNGRDVLAGRFTAGLAYAVLFEGRDQRIPNRLLLPRHLRLAVHTARDDDILFAIARLIRAYLESLQFGRDTSGHRVESPYDLFLRKNGLPTRPSVGEAPQAYSARLLEAIESVTHPTWVTATENAFTLHSHPYVFGPTELLGLRIFFSSRPGLTKYVGNCISCHPAPLFTDRQFHNNGAAQSEYDSVFGAGAFDTLYVPDLKDREGTPDQYLPPSALHPDRLGRFRSIPHKRHPDQADLGLWNVYANPDMPGSQQVVSSMLCERLLLSPAQSVPERLLPSTIGLFKTATVRDLGQSNPYFHNGALGTLEDVIGHYIQVSSMMRTKRLRNGAKELADIRVDAGAIDPIVAFLRSLDEDYH